MLTFVLAKYDTQRAVGRLLVPGSGLRAPGSSLIHIGMPAAAGRYLLAFPMERCGPDT